jgi:hypothetical protein
MSAFSPLKRQLKTFMRQLLVSCVSLKENLGENHMQNSLAAAGIERFINRAI